MALTEKVLYINFDQTHTRFICCLESGLRVYSMDPLLELDHYYTRKIGTMLCAEMKYLSNLLTFVSGGIMPKYADNSILLYNTISDEPLVEFIYSSPVLANRICSTRVVAALHNEVIVYPFYPPHEYIYAFDTGENPLGLIALTPAKMSERVIICFPGMLKGSIKIADISGSDSKEAPPPMTIQAHESELACISLNHEGTLLATASAKGTLIRVWDTISGIKVAELRRGSDTATVYCISFSRDSEFLCCSSDKGTVHIFAVKETNLNTRSTLKGIGLLGEYVDSQWAVAKFQVPAECACICTFGRGSSSVIAVCYNGSVHKYSFKLDGQCSRESYDDFLDICPHYYYPESFDDSDDEKKKKKTASGSKKSKELSS